MWQISGVCGWARRDSALFLPFSAAEHKVILDVSTKLTDAAERAAAFRVRRHRGQDAVSGACETNATLKSAVGVLHHSGAITRWISAALWGTSRLCGLCYTCGGREVGGGGIFSNCRNNKWGLSPNWHDGPVGWQQSVPSNQQVRELEYWPARAPKRAQSQSFSFHLLWQHHAVHPRESPYFYSLRWFIIDCTEKNASASTSQQVS